MISGEATVRGAPLRSEEVFKECSELSPNMIESKLRKICCFEILVLPPQHPSLKDLLRKIQRKFQEKNQEF